MSRPPGLLRRLAGDCRGMAAVEAAMVFPILIAMFLGMFELFQYMQVSVRVTTAADLTADLIAKQTQVSSTSVASTTSTPSLSTIFSATKFMLAPFTTSSSNPMVDAASILYSAPSSTGNNLTSCGTTNCRGIDWEQTYQGASASVSGTSVYQNYISGCTTANLLACYCILDPTTLTKSPPSCQANQSTIYVTVSFQYNNPVNWFLGTTPTITASAYLDPRLKFYVPLCTSSSSSSCK